ncbi:iron ABC transporter permease [Clostridia bacterium]|nr:iron ABC transporter permease [Clostridia bacterium]
MPHKSLKRIGIILSLFIAFSIAILVGRYPVSLQKVFKILFDWGSTNYSAVERAVILDVRMPRALLAILVGGALSVSGAAFQGMFHNPLVDSGILGVSSGAGFGAALAIILFNRSYGMIYLLSFVFSIIAVLSSLLIGSVYDRHNKVMLVLGGVIVSSIFSALLSFMKYVADPYDQLPSIVFWLMGSLASVWYSDVLISLIPISIGMLIIFAFRWRLNVLSMGDKEAKSMGVHVGLIRIMIITGATLATAASVAVAGVVGWIGLVIPHVGRMLVGNDNRTLIPVSFVLGGTFLLLIDTLGRSITGSELPLSILTALIGGPFYIYLLLRTKGGGW